MRALALLVSAVWIAEPAMHADESLGGATSRCSDAGELRHRDYIQGASKVVRPRAALYRRQTPCPSYMFAPAAGRIY